MKNRLLTILLLSVFIVAAMPFTVSPVTATPTKTSPNSLDWPWGREWWRRGSWWRWDRMPPVVDILSPANGTTVKGEISIVANATDDTKVRTMEYRIDSEEWKLMFFVGDSTYQAEWDTTLVHDGEHKITVKATDIFGNTGENSVTVTTDNGVAPPPPTIEYELFIEIDYMPGHEPTPLVLDYIYDYYYQRGVQVTFYADIWEYDDQGNPVLVFNATYSDMVPFDANTTNEEFWTYETLYNDNDQGCFCKWKWVLFGVSDAEYGAVAYTWVTMKRVGWTYDLLSGNYIFIADETADAWADSVGIMREGAEAVALMHEMGHSIGIGKMDWKGREIYDPDPSSVMSHLSPANAGKYTIDPETGEIRGAWYYSDEYWATRNMEYYSV